MKETAMVERSVKGQGERQKKGDTWKETNPPTN
jgi:hypothetical protein